MSDPCDITSPDFSGASCIVNQVGQAASGTVQAAANSVWDSICQSFADACGSMLAAFTKQFNQIPGPDLAAIRPVYAIGLTLGMLVALVLLLCQVATVLWTRSGAALAHAITGVFKAGLAALFTWVLAGELLSVSDELAGWIGHASGYNVAAFSAKFGKLMHATGVSGVLLLLFSLLGIVLLAVLWFELLLRNAALAIIVATAPIAAAGQIGQSTNEWWTKLVKTGINLVMLKPMIVLVFAIGFSMTGNADGIGGALSGLLVLFLAVFAWPTIGRFFTFASVQMGGAMGIGALAGAAAGHGAAGGGVDPGSFAAHSQAQTMAAASQRSGGAVGEQAASGAAAKAGAVGKIAGVAGPVGAAAVAVARGLQTTVNAVASRMEQTAGHSGAQGANPSAYPAGFPAPRMRQQKPRVPRQRPATSSGTDDKDKES